MNPYEGEFSNKLGLYWTIFCIYAAFPIAFGVLIALMFLGVV